MFGLVLEEPPQGTYLLGSHQALFMPCARHFLEFIKHVAAVVKPN
jgi:hypothetical protein